MNDFKIVYVNETSIFTIKNLQNKNFANRYHSLGLYYLINKLIKKYEIYTSDEAFEKMEKDNWDLKKVLIIQELSSKKGNKLIKLGAIPFLFICFEGPFYGHISYNKIKIYAKIFKKIIIYNNLYPGLENYQNKIINIGFPWIEENKINNDFKKLDKKEWNSRKLIVGIWSNKHYSLNLHKIIYHVKKGNFKYIIGEIITKLISKTYKKNLKYQLIDKRLDVFLNLSRYVNFDLYGRGWNIKHETPNKIYRKILNYKNSIYDGEEAKYKKLSKKQICTQYKFSLCFENAISRSYLTEKIFDCFFYKIIPIYLGAPNISDLIPEECFIDYRKFKNDLELLNYIKNISHKEANEYLQAAHNFVNSEKIFKNSCDNFSQLILRETDEYVKKNNFN